jgi:hypothetical protein
MPIGVVKHSFKSNEFPNDKNLIKEENNKKWSRLITKTNVKIYPINNSNQNFGLYSKAYISGGPKFKAYKFGENGQEDKDFKIEKLKSKKKSKTLIERFKEQDREEEKLKLMVHYFL